MHTHKDMQHYTMLPLGGQSVVDLKHLGNALAKLSYLGNIWNETKEKTPYNRLILLPNLVNTHTRSSITFLLIIQI